MRELKEMTLTEKAECFDNLFLQCLKMHNDADDKSDSNLINDHDDIITEVLGLDGDDPEHVILEDEVTVELKLLVDMRAAIVANDRNALRAFCLEISEDEEFLQLTPAELVDLSLLKWENNRWDSATRKWSLDYKSTACPLCARYRAADPSSSDDPPRKVCDDHCPLAAANPCNSDEMVMELSHGNKLHIVENLRAAKERTLETKTFTPNEVGILLAKEAAMRNANVAFNFHMNGNLTGIVVKER